MSELSMHPLVHELAIAVDLPRDAIARCMLTVPEVAPDLLAAIERAIETPELTQADVNLAYYGVFILAAARVPGLQPLLVRLLRGDDGRVHALLGGGYIENLSSFIAGGFDGDAQGLFDLLSDVRVDDHVRLVIFGTVAFLTWNGRIPVETTRAFVNHFDASKLIPEGDVGWNGWEMAIELLGWEEFTPRVEAAYADGRLETGMSELRFFRKGVAEAAAAAPDDGRRFTHENLGTIDDILDVLTHPAPNLAAHNEAVAVAAAKAASPPRTPYMVPETHHNPLRHVGRNDPCPCGSGKKYKKCCLAA